MKTMDVLEAAKKWQEWKDMSPIIDEMLTNAMGQIEQGRSWELVAQSLGMTKSALIAEVWQLARHESRQDWKDLMIKELGKREPKPTARPNLVAPGRKV